MSGEHLKPKPEELINLKEVCFGEERYVAPSWEDMGEICFKLAKEILDCGDKHDRLVTLAKGGWTWSRTMADYLAIEEVASVRVLFYRGVGQTAEMPIITQSLPVNINGESVLLFDDVDDTGKSLTTARDYLNMCGAATITIASLFHKPWSQITPDFFGAETSAWIIFPHEIRESIRDLSGKWRSLNIGGQEITNRFHRLNLNPGLVKFFLNLEVKD